MHLEGWNSIPAGYGARFDLAEARWWLRAWFHTPFLDLLPYPLVVRHGYGLWTAHPGRGSSELGPVPSGWRVTPPDWRPAHASAEYRPDPRHCTTRRRSRRSA